MTHARAFENYTLTDWLFHLENRYQQEVQLGLTRIKSVATRLGLLRFNCPIITVGGTNGKGSTVAALESIYLAAGFRVASYTSPHLLSFNERIKINNKSISDEHLCKAFLFLEQNRGETPLTYFETATLAALWYFKQSSIDIMILEVGMGGRLDATNILDSDLAVITTIELDHQQFLGNTFEAIGAEKAGILRPHTPFIYADYNPPVSILKQAQKLQTPMYLIGRDYTFIEKDNRLNMSFAGKHIDLPVPHIHLNSAAAAIAATICLYDKLPVDLNACKQAMDALHLLGRQTILYNPVTTIFDVAHNKQAVVRLVNLVKNIKKEEGKVHAVFSALKDKNPCDLIQLMSTEVHHWYPVALNSKRAVDFQQINNAFKQTLGESPACFKTPYEGYCAAVSKAQCCDLIVVFGSFLTVSGVLSHVYKEKDEIDN